MTLHLALSELSTVDNAGYFIDAQAVSMADIVLIDTPEDFSVGENLLTCTMFETFDSLALQRLEKKNTSKASD